MDKRDPLLHVFFVHSHITLICAMGVIQKENLDAESIRMVFLRGYHLPTPFREFTFPFPASRDSENSFFGLTRKHILGARKQLGKLDAFVADVTEGRAMHAYFPQTRWDFYHLLITHPDCSRFSILEEGNTSYWRSNEYARQGAESLKTRVKLAAKRLCFVLLFGLRGMGKGEFRQSYAFIGRGAYRHYGFSEDVYPDAPRRVVLDLRSSCHAAGPLFNQPKLPKNVLVIVLGDLIFADTNAWETYLHTLKDHIAAGVGMGVQMIAYKHHPTVSPRRSDVEAVIEATASSFDLPTQKLDASVCLELLAADVDGIVFAGRSSAQRYAAMLGAQQLDGMKPGNGTQDACS